MHVYVLQHVPFEGLGSIAGWLIQQRAIVCFTRINTLAHTLLDNVAGDIDTVCSTDE